MGLACMMSEVWARTVGVADSRLAFELEGLGPASLGLEPAGRGSITWWVCCRNLSN